MTPAPRPIARTIRRCGKLFCGSSGWVEVIAESPELDAESSSLASVALASARAADLVVVAQKDAAWSQSPHLDIDGALILGSGRPVLVVPNEGLCSLAARRIMVAWNDSREATRAVFDALPFLRQAEDVAIFTVADDELDSQTRCIEPAICASLARHDVKCRATQIVSPHVDVGRSLTQ